MIIKTVEDLRNALRDIPGDYEIKVSDGNLRLNLVGVSITDERKNFGDSFGSGDFGWYTNHYCMLNLEKGV